MKLFSRLLQTSPRLLQILAIIPLLAIYIPSHAEVDIDGREESEHRVEFSQAELDQILAPIALYPDTILSQVLIAATYPIEVVQADRWASTNTNVKGADAVTKVENKDWDPSVKALVAFPDILQRMSDDIDWTQKLGDAFLSDEARVMDSIQSLRKKAYSSGSLNKVKHLKVERDKEIIIIEPAEERVVYVPVYDTRVVYGNWWWPDYPPVYWHHPTSYAYVSGFYWGPSIYIGPTFFYSSCRWRERHVVVVDRYSAYGSRPVFYSGRSIVNYHGATRWRHEPLHRRGVAYYNNDLRTRYGNQRESYRDARVYREQHSEQRSKWNAQPRNERGNDRSTYRTNDRNNTIQSRPTTDRSEQLRERISRTNNNTATPTIESNSNDGKFRPPRQTDNRGNDANRQNNDARVIRNRDQTNPGEIKREQNIRSGVTAPAETRRANDLGATRPALTAEPVTRPERVRENRAEAAPRAREIHNDGRNVRQLQSERIEQRQNDQPRRERSGNVERNQNRPERAM